MSTTCTLQQTAVTQPFTLTYCRLSKVALDGNSFTRGETDGDKIREVQNGECVVATPGPGPCCLENQKAVWLQCTIPKLHVE